MVLDEMTIARAEDIADRVQALEEAVERIEQRVPFVSRFVPQDAYYHKLNNLIEAARVVEAMRLTKTGFCVSVRDLDNLRDAVNDLLAASWGRA